MAEVHFTPSCPERITTLNLLLYYMHIYTHMLEKYLVFKYSDIILYM